MNFEFIAIGIALLVGFGSIWLMLMQLKIQVKEEAKKEFTALAEAIKWLREDVRGIREDIKELRQDFKYLDTKIDKVNSDLSVRIEKINSDLSVRIEKINSDLSSRIEKINSDLSSRIDRLADAMYAKKAG